MFATPRLIISGLQSGCDSSLVTLGLVASLRKKGRSVTVCTSSTDFIQGLIFRRISGRYVRTLTPSLLSPQQIISSIDSAGVGANLVIVDGAGLSVKSSTISGPLSTDPGLAKNTGTPLIVVVDRNLPLEQSGLESIRHLKQLDPSPLKGLIVIGEQSLSPLPEELADIPVVGVISPNGITGIMPTVSFTQSQNIASLPLKFFVDLEHSTNKGVDLALIVSIAEQADPLKSTPIPGASTSRQCRVAVAEDTCFSVLFQDNLELLRFFGAEVKGFSPLTDSDLPRNTGALYLPGAFLTEYASEFAANTSIKQSIKKFVQAGGVLYSEGAGTAILFDEYSAPGDHAVHHGVGLITGRISARTDSEMTPHSAILLEDGVIGQSGSEMKGILAGKWNMRGGERTPRILRISLPGNESVIEGYSPTAQSFCTLGFLHWGSNPEIARSLVEAGTVFKPLAE